MIFSLQEGARREKERTRETTLDDFIKLEQQQHDDDDDLLMPRHHTKFDHENDKSTSELLKPNDDIYGNFLEILFCRLVRCTNQEQELRLKRLFFESILLKNAKLTCSTNMLNLFLTNNQEIKQKLINKYFPCLFYMSNSFSLFQSDLHEKRFTMLTNWLTKQLFFTKSTII